MTKEETQRCMDLRLHILGGVMELLPDGFRMLEIGVFTGNVIQHTALTLERKKASYVGVDVDLTHLPFVRASDRIRFVQSTSDDFFSKPQKDDRFDLVFVDGDHTSPAAERDTQHSIEHLQPGGIIVLHDIGSPTVAPYAATRAAFRLLLSDSRFFCRLFVEDDTWLGATAVGIDMDRESVVGLFEGRRR